MNNYYEILEVSPKASTDVIEAVYKRLAKKYHPDLQEEHKRAGFENKMKEINLAYETLKDPVKRKQYDDVLMKARINSEFKAAPEMLRKSKEHKLKAKKNRNAAKVGIFVVLSLLGVFGIYLLTTSSGMFGKTNYASDQPRIVAIDSLDTATRTASSGEEATKENYPGVPENRFTLGSSQAVVKKVMGEPTSVFLCSWSYGSSLVYFDKDGKVDGWAKVDKSLRAWLGNKIRSAPPFKAGSTKEEVIKAMGTPTSLFEGSWSYGKSSVYFDEYGRVSNWVEIDKHLKTVAVKKPKSTK